MSAHPISVRLDDEVRKILELDAKEHHIGLATYLRNLAGEQAKALRKARIRASSRRVGELVAKNPEARAFYEEVGTPTAEL
jgi:GNAT superfamily N-acetyltransferase